MNASDAIAIELGDSAHLAGNDATMKLKGKAEGVTLRVRSCGGADRLVEIVSFIT